SLLSCHESYRTLLSYLSCFFFNAPSPTSIYTLSLHDALPICEDGAERGSLGVIGALVDIGGDAPVAVRHRPRRVRRQRDVEAVERDLVVVPLLYMEEQGHVAGALARPRRQRRRC